MPFPTFFVFLEWLFLLAIGAILLGFGLLKKSKSYWKVIAGTIFLLWTLISIIVTVIVDVKTEFNPIVDRQELVGKWEYSNCILTLSYDNTYYINVENEELKKRLRVKSSTGHWTKADWNLDLNDNSGNQLTNLRVIKFNNEYRIIIEDFLDFDMWDGDLGFKKASDITLSPSNTAFGFLLSR